LKTRCNCGDRDVIATSPLWGLRCALASRSSPRTWEEKNLTPRKSKTIRRGGSDWMY